VSAAPERAAGRVGGRVIDTLADRICGIASGWHLSYDVSDLF
jgi:hypothetical protein